MKASTGLCDLCTGDGAKTCSEPTKTIDCKDGYFKTVTNNVVSCTECGSTKTNAKSCSNANTDTNCNSGFFKNANNVCTSCNDANAIECSAASLATKCKDGYVVSNNVCTPCAGGVKTCTAPNVVAKATDCLSGFYKTSSNDCYPCLGLNVATCSD